MILRETVAQAIHERRGRDWDENPLALLPQPTWEEAEELWGGDPGCSWADGVRRDADAAIAAILDALIAEATHLNAGTTYGPEESDYITRMDLLDWLRSKKDGA